jgi:hypothetical protein
MVRPSHLTPRPLVRHCSNQHHRRGISWGRTGLRTAQLLKVDLLHQFRASHKSPHGKPLLRKRVACPEGLILGGFCKPIGAIQPEAGAVSPILGDGRGPDSIRASGLVCKWRYCPQDSSIGPTTKTLRRLRCRLGMCSGVCLSFNRGIWGSFALLVGEDGLRLAF